MTEAKKEYARVHEDWNSVFRSEPRKPNEIPYEVQGEYTRVTGESWQRKISNYVDLDGMILADALDTLNKAAEGLHGVRIDVTTTDDYEGPRTEMTVEGYRPATTEEVEWLNVYIANQVHLAEKRNLASVERFKREHPDWEVTKKS